MTEDGSPRGGVTFALWEPPLLAPSAREVAATHAPLNAATHAATHAPSPAHAAVHAATHIAVDADPARGSAAPVADAAQAPPGVLPPWPDARPAVAVGPVGDAEPVRRSAVRETADLLTDLVVAGVRTVAFVRSRRGAEMVATMARR